MRIDFEAGERASSFTAEHARKLMDTYFDATSAEIIRLQPYTFYAGMPKKWRKDRDFIIGDAAHLTPRFAGQGLNMGMRDAVNLADN